MTGLWRLDRATKGPRLAGQRPLSTDRPGWPKPQFAIEGVVNLNVEV